MRIQTFLLIQSFFGTKGTMNIGVDKHGPKDSKILRESQIEQTFFTSARGFSLNSKILRESQIEQTFSTSGRGFSLNPQYTL